MVQHSVCETERDRVAVVCRDYLKNWEIVLAVLTGLDLFSKGERKEL